MGIDTLKEQSDEEGQIKKKLSITKERHQRNRTEFFGFFWLLYSTKSSIMWS
jgi:hypothetical protein